MVGNWILEGSFQPAMASADFQSFLRTSLLPWLMEGHLFVSTLQQSRERTFSCTHGIRLSAFVRDTLKDRTAAGPLLTVYLKHVLDNRSKIFVYAAVYILDGIAQSNVAINEAAYANILELSKWQALPEIAKELFRRTCWTIVSSEQNMMHLQDSLDELKTQYGSLQARFGGSPDMGFKHLSGRELKTRAALEKSVKIRDGGFETVAALEDALDDVWSDLEYLVYPRELLEAYPAALLSPSTLKLALSPGGGSLAPLIRSMIQRLLDLAENRSNLIASVMIAIREAVLAVPAIVPLLDLDKTILQIAQSPPQATVDLQFESACFELLSERYGSSKLSSPSSETSGYAAYFSLIAQLGDQQDSLRSVKDSIVARWKRQKIPPPTLSAFKSTAQLQVLVLCSEQLQYGKQELSDTMDDMFFLMSLEPLPRYRYLFAWIIIRLMMRFPEEQHRIIQQLNTTEHHTNPKYLAAIMKLAVELAREIGTQEYAVNLASTFIALSASSKVVIRHEAQWSFPLLIDLAGEKQWTELSSNSAYQALDRYIRSLPRFDEPPPDRIYSRFNPAQHNTMVNLVQGLWTELDYTGPPLTQFKDLTWLADQDRARHLVLPQPCLELGTRIDLPQHYKPSAKIPPKLADDELVALQTKGSAYLKNILGIDMDLKPKSHQLIVLATLVTNPYNLGGLSRVSEIFGAQQMLVGDPKVVDHKDFTSVAVSSHHHLDISALAVDGIASFLAEKKVAGWTVVGVEQTDRSEMLGKSTTALPEKTILVIGNEREGMPGAFIGLCDVLVEIPQRGVTRSMNVQTVAAVVLYEFNRQQEELNA